jgi:hypothetical protein
MEQQRAMNWKSWELYHSTLYHPSLTYPVLARQSQIPATMRKSTLPRSTGGLNYTPFISIGSLLMLMLCLFNVQGVFVAIFSHIETILVLSVFGVIFLSTIAPGLNLALKVSGAIYDEQAKGRYDLLALMPRGAAALHWALAIKCNRQDRFANGMRNLVLNLGSWLSLPTAAVLLPLLIIALIMLVLDASGPSVAFFTTVSLPLIALTAYYVDYVQSSVIAFLISIIVPAWWTSHSRVWMSWVAPLSFLALQVLSYMIFLIVLFEFNTRLWTSPSIRGEMTAFFSLLLFIIGILAIREAIVFGLWRWALSLFGDELRILRLD